MFPGWADSVLWLSGPLVYDELGLPAALVAALDEWDLVWSKTAGPDAQPASRQARRQHVRVGRRLAPLVAEAFGDGVLVELRLGGRWSRRRYRSRGRATVPRASEVVIRYHEELVRARAAAVADGGRGEWRMEGPGEVSPNRASPDDG